MVLYLVSWWIGEKSERVGNSEERKKEKGKQENKGSVVRERRQKDEGVGGFGSSKRK